MPYKDRSKQRKAQSESVKRNRASNNKNRTKARRAAKDKIRALKDNPCTDCRERHPYYVMQFDHKPGETKVECVAVMVSKNAAWARIEKEVAKCDLVCANCHAKRTHIRTLG